MQKKLSIGLVIVFLMLLVLCVSALSGCDAKTTQKLSADKLYRRDMILTVNGVTEEGVIAVPMLAENTIKVVSRGDLDMFAMQNCSGEWIKEKAWNVTETVRTGLFGWGKKVIDKKREVEFKYYPSGLERLGSCPLQLSGFSKSGQHSWGFVDFKTDSFKLKGQMTCNSVTSPFDGVFACQSRAGLYQKLFFEKPVTVSPDPGCELDKEEGKEFTFPMPKGMCVYRIEDLADGSILGKITLIGYESILIRE